MKKEKISLKGLLNISPVLLAQLGLVLLVLPDLVPIEDKNVAMATFIAALALLGYATGCTIGYEIRRAKSYSSKEIERQVKEEIAKRKQSVLNKNNTIQR